MFDLWNCLKCNLRFTFPVPQEHEIAQYYKAEHYVSHNNSARGLINKMYRFARRFTLSAKRRFVQRRTGLPGGSLLDVGTGVGAFLHEMKVSGWQVMGVEPDPDAREYALNSYKVSVFEPAQLFEFTHNSFDAITLWHVLEHVYNLHGYIQQFGRLLKQDGLLFIAVPNYTSGDARFYGEYWAAYDVPRHLYHFSPGAMQALANRNGFRIIAQKAMWLDAFYISLLSEKYKHGRNRYVGGLYRGMISALEAFFNTDHCSSLIYVLKKEYPK